MTGVAWDRVEPLVAEALDLHGPARAAFLDRACRGDLALRREVESLLKLDENARGFLEGSALEEAARSLTGEVGPAAMLGRQIAGYRIDALIGAGGMGEVYRARDLRLDRDVALKVLAEPAAHPGERARVEREARAASRLNHPNIVTVHAVGEDGEVGFIAMELVAGRTLREILADGPVPIAEGLSLAVQLTDALAAAHAEGIVHRDLKPENVMVTSSGLVKVLDFGIAGREQGGHDESPPAGTAGYMSPEQARGEPARAASDQFSLGVILYEMLAGRPPFARAGRGEAPDTTGAAPPPLESVVPAVPGALAALVARCLAADPDQRYARTEEIASALRSVRARLDAPRLSRRLVLFAGVGAIAAAAAGTGLWLGAPAGGARRSVAVLPFRNTTGDADADYLGDGLTATLIARLAVMPALSVRPRSLISNFKGAADDARAVGRQLDVDLVLAGTVARRGGRLLVGAHLDEVRTGRTLWTGQYDRPAGELLIVEEQLAQAIVDEGVRLTVSAEQRRRLARRPTSDPVAWELYLQAVYLCQRETEEAYLDARDLLAEALDRDPHFAAGHVQMATTFAVMAVDGHQRPTEAWPESSRHVRRALDVDPDMADAHAAAASHEFFFHWNWEAAEDEWRRAMRFGGEDLHPDLNAARALQRWAIGRLDDALALARKARALDPVTPMFAIREADFLLHAGRPDEAATIYQGVLAAHPDDTRARFGLSEAYRRQGRLDEAVAERRAAHLAADEPDVVAGPLSKTAADELARIDARGARAQLARLQARALAGAYVSPLDFAREHARLGEADEAARHFEAAVADRAPGLTMLDVDAAWDGLRGDARFRALRARVGLG